MRTLASGRLKGKVIQRLGNGRVASKNLPDVTGNDTSREGQGKPIHSVDN